MCRALCACWNPFHALPEGHFPRRTAVHVLVFQLDTDDRAVILKKQPLKLSSNLPIEFLHVSEVAFIIRPYREFSPIHPIGDATVSAFAVCKRADANKGINLMFSAQL